MNENLEAPQGWGNDALTGYLNDVRRNQWATFHRKGAAVGDLIRMDKAFSTLLDGAINLRPWFPAQFFLRAHSAFRVASGCAMAGQLYEINAAFRTCLELAAYGLYVGADNARAEQWLRRHDDELAMQKMKDTFTIRKVKDHIKAKAPKVAQTFSQLYEHAIDYGGHPNERGFSSNMDIIHEDDRIEIRAIYLQDGSKWFDFALKRTGQVGLWALIAAQMIWTERVELLGVREEIDRLKGRF